MRIGSEHRRGANNVDDSLHQYAAVVNGTGSTPVPLAAVQRAPVPHCVRVDGKDSVLWRAERVATQHVPYFEATLIIEDVRRESMPGFARRASVRGC